MDDTTAFIRELESRGYEVVPTRSGHRQINFNGHTISTMSSTPSDHRALLNVRSQVKRFEKSRLDLKEEPDVPDSQQGTRQGNGNGIRAGARNQPGNLHLAVQQQPLGGNLGDRREHPPADQEGPDGDLPERVSVPVREPRDQELAARIKQAIVVSGLKQNYIAEKTGIEYTALSRIVHGKRRISSLELALIADATGTATEDILNIDGPPVQVHQQPEPVFPLNLEKRPASMLEPVTFNDEPDNFPGVRAAIEEAEAYALAAEERHREPLGEEVTYIVQRSPEGTLDWEDWAPMGDHELLARRRYEDARKAVTGYRLVKRTVIISDEVLEG